MIYDHTNQYLIGIDLWISRLWIVKYNESKSDIVGPNHNIYRTPKTKVLDSIHLSGNLMSIVV